YQVVKFAHTRPVAGQGIRVIIKYCCPPIERCEACLKLHTCCNGFQFADTLFQVSDFDAGGRGGRAFLTRMLMLEFLGFQCQPVTPSAQCDERYSRKSDQGKYSSQQV